MIWVLALLGVTILLFVTEVFRVDVVAILIMVIIGLSSLVPDFSGLVPISRLFDGFFQQRGYFNYCGHDIGSRAGQKPAA